MGELVIISKSAIPNLIIFPMVKNAMVYVFLALTFDLSCDQTRKSDWSESEPAWFSTLWDRGLLISDTSNTPVCFPMLDGSE